MSASKASRPNVLMIADHDLVAHLGCYGHPIVKTPHLDRLAARGVVFQSNFCAYPVCNASRASLMTGRRPDTTHVYNNWVWFRHTLPTVDTLPRVFRRNGYWTGSAGNVFHSHMDDEQAWDQGHQPYPPPPPPNEPYRVRADIHRPSDEPDSRFADVQTAEQAVAMLHAHAEEPFFIAAGFHAPHVPLVAPRRFFDLYSINDIPLPPRRPPDAPAVPQHAWRPNFNLFIDRPIEDDEARQATLAYYACTSFMDEQVGKILGTVDELDLWDNTIVVFWVDHGFHLGDKGYWAKQTLYDPSTRVPLIVANPGTGIGGEVVHRLTENVDLYPTLVELCDLPMSDGLEGTSFVPLLSDPQQPWKCAAFCQAVRGDVMGRMARSERWHYVRWGDCSAEELYDMAADPDQLINLARDSHCAAALSEMRALLDAGWRLNGLP